MARALRLRGTLTALSEIHHGGDEQTGNVRLLRTVKVYDPEVGKPVRVPVISGNAIRGVLRRKIMFDLLERIDYGAVSTKLHHALMAGGTLEATGDTGVGLDLTRRRELTQAVPPIALLGTAILNDMIPGQMVVNFARPLCREMAWCLTAQGYDDPRVTLGARSYRDFTFTTRRDDLRDEAEVSHQMIATFEYFAAGTQFAHEFVLRHPTPVLAGCLSTMIQLWQDDPVIGGKGGTGFGQLALDYGDLPDTTPYDDFIDGHAEGIRDTLNDLAGRFVGGGKKAEAQKGVAFEQVLF